MASTTPIRTIYCGPFAHSISPSHLEICTTGAIGVDENGKIAFVSRTKLELEAHTAAPGWKDAKTVQIGGCNFFFPGFVDTHIHASQYPNAGIFGKSTLLDWLNTYTFPLESSLSNLKRASHVYNQIVYKTLSHGTTTAAYYATTHVDATNLLADVCKARGQRAFVGRVCMDSMGPEAYKDESAADTIRRTRACIAHVDAIDPTRELLTPIITPRFAPACSVQCLGELGELHRKTGLPVQTHVCENKPEIELVRKLFPTSDSYVGVYDDFGLLGSKTILAHAVHLTEAETDLICKREAKISHCPSSNTALTSGCARVRNLMERGIDMGLGTDVSGGFSASVLEVARQAIWVSRFVAMSDGDAAKLSVEDVLYLATRGGARVVGLDERTGGFDVGKDWDAQMVVLNSVETEPLARGENDAPVDVFGWEGWEDRIHKWVYGGDDRNTAAVWVRGRLVHSTSRYKAASLPH